MMTMSRVFSAFAFFFLLSSSASAQSTNWGRGPIELADQFPLALPHADFTGGSPAVLPARHCRFHPGFAWTNTINQRRNYLVDAEVRTANLALDCGTGNDFQLGFDLPIVYRGGGTLDHAIYEWHELWGLPQGPRDDPGAREDRYAISGANGDGALFNWKEKGTKTGDVTLRAKYLVSPGDDRLPAFALTESLRLPTGAATYGQEAIDLVSGALFSKRWRNIALYTGAAHIFIGDAEIEGVHYARNRAALFSYAEYELSGSAALLAGLHASSRLVKDLPGFPDYELYLDLGGKLALPWGFEAEVLLRENPSPARGTADVTFFFGLNRLFFL